MKIREIRENEINKLLSSMAELAEHHNKVSINFKGSYPGRPYKYTLSSFLSDMQQGISKIAIVEENGEPLGFCKINILENEGKIDYLVVNESQRGKGYGSELMDWAMESFKKRNISKIEVKVVDGNSAIYLYEKYGFKMNAHILCYCEKDN